MTTHTLKRTGLPPLKIEADLLADVEVDGCRVRFLRTRTSFGLSVESVEKDIVVLLDTPQTLALGAAIWPSRSPGYPAACVEALVRAGLVAHLEDVVRENPDEPGIGDLLEVIAACHRLAEGRAEPRGPGPGAGAGGSGRGS